MIKGKDLQKSLSKIDFAKLAGVHRSSITRAIKAGSIPSDSIGNIDPLDKRSLQYLKNQIDKKLGSIPVGSRQHKDLEKDYNFLTALLAKKQTKAKEGIRKKKGEGKNKQKKKQRR